jgi:(p)ppGpp synthase/HD superfamily hydrolase
MTNPQDKGSYALSYLTWAIHTAQLAHQDQVDKIGEPYINHPYRVAAACDLAGFGEDVITAAWLHDVVEDTAVTLDSLRPLLPASVVDALDALTKRKGEPFGAYYERVKADPIATVVKWFDVADNADPRRLAKVAPDTQDRLRDKYERARALLTDPTAKGSSTP